MYIKKLLASSLFCGLIMASNQVNACVDYSGYYQRGNISITFKQNGCNSLDKSFTTAGTPSINEHSDLNNSNEGYSWIGPNLVYIQNWGPHKDIATYTLDSSGNLVMSYMLYWNDGSIEDFGKTVFKKVQ